MAESSEWRVLKNGSRIHSTARVHPDAVIGKGVEIGPDAGVGQGAKIGDNVTVGGGAQLHSGVSVGSFASIGEDTTVRSGAQVGGGTDIGRDSIVGGDAKIEPYCRVGPEVNIGPGAKLYGGAQLGEGAHLGSKGIVFSRGSIGREAFVGANSWVGTDSKVAPNAKVPQSVRLGDRVTVSEGARFAGSGVVRVPTTFVQKYTPRAPLKPSGAPEPASGRGRPAAAGDRRDSVRNKWAFWLNSSAAWNTMRSMSRICKIQYPKPHFMDRAVKTVAYLRVRVSTPQQDVRSQRLAILEYARTHDIRIDDFIEATASGQASEKRRRLDDLTNA